MSENCPRSVAVERRTTDGSVAGHRLIVAGSRSFGSAGRSRAKGIVISLIRSLPQSVCEVVSGTARGADSVGEDAAAYLGIPVEQFPADWDRHGKRAGLIRNEEMAEYADSLLAIWDGESSGTHHMIKTASRELEHVVVWNYVDERVVPLTEIPGAEVDE